MARKFTEIAFTESVKALQLRHGSRRPNEALERARNPRDSLTRMEIAFIQARDSFYQATVSETGWPYVQFRGGPAGFLKVLDARTLGYADYRGNVQYISAGNLTADGRTTLILVDYAGRLRLKIWARACLVDAADDAALIRRVSDPGYAARIERAVVMTVEAFDWNCPRHITPRFTLAEIRHGLASPNGPVSGDAAGTPAGLAGSCAHPSDVNAGQAPALASEQNRPRSNQ